MEGTSHEVAIVAIIEPAPGKLERLKELMANAIEWMKTNEPETLEFSFYEEQTEKGVRLSMFERYASQAAVDKHESSENYKNFFKTAVEEELLAGPPIISKGKYCGALRR